MMKKVSMERRHLFGSRQDRSTPALFLDRDGVMIDDIHYLNDPEKVRVLSGVDVLLTLAMTRGWPVVVITNQSGVSRGFFDWATYDAVTERMMASLKGRNAIKAIYANGYGPEQGNQPWRKPNPGMIVEAAFELNIDLNKSVLVGDRLSDLRAGLNAELSTLIHVRTGHGNNDREDVIKEIQASLLAKKEHHPAVHMIDDLTVFPPTVLCQVPIHP